MKQFTASDVRCLEEIIEARRDIRGNRFIDKKIDDEILDKLLNAASNAPSVGFSQPWKFVIVKDSKKREEIYQDFVKENEKAKEIFKDRELYSKLKLEGIKEADLNIAVLYEKSDKEVLGQTTQKKMGEYSVVCAIQNFWLMARAFNIGVGWVSILKPKRVKKILNIEKNHKLIAYLTVGYVDKFLDEPELLTLDWEKRKSLQEIKVI